MKTNFLSSLILAVCCSSAAAFAADLSASDLFFAGYRGELTDQGIAKYNSFCWDWKTHKMSAASLAKAGVEAGLLSQAQAEDKGYLNQVIWSIQRTCGYN